MMRIKKALLIIILVCILMTILIPFLPSISIFFSTLGEEETPLEAIIYTIKGVCDIFPDDEREKLCPVINDVCEGEPDVIGCVADVLVRINKTEAARKVCELAGPATFLQRYCMANALASIDLNASLKECDSMEGVVRYFCRADQKRKVLGIDAGLPECEKIEDLDEVHFCRAIVYASIDNELAKKECILIIDGGRERECLSLFK